MLGQNPSQPAIFQMVDIDALVPEDHRLRQIDAALELGFVREELATCYTPGRGRPSIDPELAVRMMILGVLYDLSDRQLCDEIRMHAGFRWFCRLNFHDPVPDHSTLSRLRNERWAGSELFTKLFDEVVRSCVEAGLVSGHHVSVDGTQIKANASMQSLEARTRPEEEKDDDAGANPPRAKEPQPAGVWQGHGQRYSNETHVSHSDPEALLYRKGRNEGAKLSYLVHDLIDTKSRVILGRHASQATGTAERDMALVLLDEHEMRREELGMVRPAEFLSADAGYGVSRFVAEVLERGVVPHTPLQAKDELEPIPTWKRRTFNEAHKRARAEKVRLAEARNRVRLAQQTEGYAVSRKLRIRSEHVFAEAKNRHGLGRARHRGLEKVDRHAQFIAAVQNLKRLSRTLWHRTHNPTGDSPTLGPLVHALRAVRERLNNFAMHARRKFSIGTGSTRISAWIHHHRMAFCSTAF